MKTQKILKIIFLSSLVWLLFMVIGFCGQSNNGGYVCEGQWLNILEGLVGADFDQSLFFFPLVLLVISTILFFLREEVFRAWWKFARIYLPIALVLILISSPDAGGGFAMDVGSGYDREGMVWFTSGLFFVISVILIAYKALKLKFSIGSK